LGDEQKVPKDVQGRLCPAEERSLPGPQEGEPVQRHDADDALEQEIEGLRAPIAIRAVEPRRMGHDEAADDEKDIDAAAAEAGPGVALRKVVARVVRHDHERRNGAQILDSVDLASLPA